MDKKYYYVLWSMTFYFSWFLSFPYFGSVISNISKPPLIEHDQISLIFIIFHALGFLTCALLLKSASLWRKLIYSSLIIIIPLNLSLILALPFLWLPLIALIGFFSSFYVMGWSVVFSSLSTLQKIRLYALALMMANLAAFLISYISSWLAHEAVVLLLVTPLLVSLLLTHKSSANIDLVPLSQKKKSADLPSFFLVTLLSIVFILHFSFGFMFALLDGSFPAMQENLLASRYFYHIPYLLTCLVAFIFASSISLRYLPQLGISLFGLGFIVVLIFNNNAPGFYLAHTVVETAVVLISVFMWVVQGELARVCVAPYRFFGFGLFTTLLAVFCGRVFGSIIFNLDEYYLLSAILYAVAAILAIMVAVPWLFDKVSTLISSGTVREKQNIAHQFNNEDLLTSSLIIAPSLKKNATRDNPLGIRTLDVLLSPSEKTVRLIEAFNAAALTEREKEIVTLMLQGKTNRAIAEELFIAENTIKTHSRNIYEKFNVSNKNKLLVKLAGKK